MESACTPSVAVTPGGVRRVVSRLAEVVAEAGTLEAEFGGAVFGRQAAGAERVAAFLDPLLAHEACEVFLSLLVDGRHRVFALAEVSRGTLTSSLVHPREVFGPALRHGACAVLVAHNHPSGEPEPSREDLDVTRRLLDAGTLLGVPLLDHLILGANGAYVSLRTRLPFG